MKLCYTILNIVEAILILFILQSNDAMARPPAHRRILFINSYDPSFPTFNAQYGGLSSSFDSRYTTINVLFMDCKSFASQENLNLFAHRVEYKLKHSLPYDAVVASDDDAFNYVVQNKNTLFRKIPIFFMGVNNLPAAQKMNNDPQVTGITENLSVKPTLNLMIRLFPKHRYIYILADNSFVSTITLEEISNSLKSYPHERFRFINSSMYSFDDYYALLSRIDPNDVVLYLNTYLDKYGHVMSFDETFYNIRTHLRAPFFYLLKFGIGKGPLGGHVISMYNQGRIVGDMIKKVWGGRSMKSFAAADKSYQYVFDYNVMQKFGIQRDQLPEESIIINMPESPLKVYKNTIIIVLLLFVFLLSMILVLVRSIINRKKYTNELIAKNIQLKEKEKEVSLAKEKADESNRMKDAFIHNLTHEIKTPLNGIIGFTEVLFANSKDKENDIAYVEVIRQSTKQLTDIIHNLLEISSLETKQVKLNEEYICLNDVLTNIYNMFHTRSKAILIPLFMEKALSNDDSVFKTDAAKIIKVMSILLDNAFKFTERGSIHFGYQINSNQVVLYVQDTGIGISEEQKEMIFNRFTQGETDLNRKYEGLGLGLAIAKENVNLLHGTISLTSQVGKGSTFFIKLPFVKD